MLSATKQGLEQLLERFISGFAPVQNVPSVFKSVHNQVVLPENYKTKIENFIASKQSSNKLINNALHEFILKDQIPYFHYTYLSQAGYAFHPMQAGHYLTMNPPTQSIIETANQLLTFAHSLPNEGLAWYYPKHYKNARMTGPDYHYSGISQGELLAAYSKLSLYDSSLTAPVLKKIFQSILFPYENGGILLANQAILEMPSYRGSPEIILNGWIDTLLNLDTYIQVTQDREAIALREKNLNFLISILPSFDLPEQRLSRYSDLSPYKVWLSLPRAKKDIYLEARYEALVPGLPNFAFPLEKLDQDLGRSIYDNQIWDNRDTGISISLSFSKHYKTSLFVSDSATSVKIKTGKLSFMHTVPAASEGETIKLKSKPVPGGKLFEFNSIQSKLICGYPTNFLKQEDGTEDCIKDDTRPTNFYHPYHVVTLLLLAKDLELTPAAKKIAAWGIHWLNYIEQPNPNFPTNYRFYNLQALFETLNRRRMKPLKGGFNDLKAWASNL